jgi:hypothetical protein
MKAPVNGTREGIYACIGLKSAARSKEITMERERDTEQWLRKKVEQMGGMAYKFTSPGNAGVPDRLVVFPGGLIYFVELKTSKGSVKPIQKWQQDKLRAMGCHVVTIYGMEGAKALIWDAIDRIPGGKR